jgi:thermostable 8-oxoguanine DNA glycosylase
VEIKYKADSSDIAKRVLRKAETFRVNFPQYKDKKVFLALAGMSISPLTEQSCSENGIAIIKQVGETIVVIDNQLKAF